MRAKKYQGKGYRHPDHPLPVTRRQLLSQGFLSVSASILAPSVLGIISRRAYADTSATCTTAAAAGSVPVIIIDLAGGANIAGTNIIVGAKGSQTNFLPAGSYASIGLTGAQEPSAAGITPNAEYGLLMHPASQMLAGLNSITSTTTRANTEGALFCTVSGDDTGTNPLSPVYWLAAGGLGGSLVPIIGSNAGSSGGNSAAPPDSIQPSDEPSRITGPSDATGLVNPGTLATLLGAGGAADTAGVTKVMNAVATMSSARLAQFNAMSVPAQVQTLINCGYINATGYLSKFLPSALDPTQDPKVTALFPDIANDNNQAAGASISKLVLDGYAGVGVITLGGYDYHGQGRPAQNAMDLAAGTMMGRVLELAAQKNSPVMLIVYTDGGVSSNASGDVNGIYPWEGDSGQRSSAFTLVYNPAAKPAIRHGTRQIGGFNSTGAVDTTVCAISNNVETLSKTFAVNWLALQGLEANATTAIGPDPFGGQIENYLAFAKLT